MTMTPEHRAAWLEQRRLGIGGSDASVICGVNPWMSPFELYLDKIGEGEEVEDNPSMMWGRIMEPVIRERYQEDTGCQVTVPDGAIVHPTHTFMRANLDGLCDDRILEIKTARYDMGWGPDGSDEIPEHYLAQVQHYMTVVGYQIADVAALIGGSDFRIYTIESDPELAELLIEQERLFWARVTNRKPPPFTTARDIALRFGGVHAKGTIDASIEVMEAVADLLLVKKEKKDLESRENRLKMEIQEFMGEHEALAGNGEQVLATWKTAKPGKQFIVDELKKKHPEIYAECCVDKKTQRRFLTK